MKRSLVFALAIPLVVGASAVAQPWGFDGSTSNPGDFNDPLNWNSDTLPFDDLATLVDVGVDPALNAGALLNATANITGGVANVWEFRAGRGDNSVGTVNHSAGTLAANNWSFIGVDGVGATAQGTYNLSGTGVLDGGNVWFVGFGGGTGSSQGHMSFADQSQASFGAFVVGANDGNVGTVNQTGGDVSYSDSGSGIGSGGWMTIGESSGSQGTYNMSGGSLTQNVDFLTIGENGGAVGNLNVSGTSVINLNAAGTALGRRDGGTGTISISGSTPTFNTTDIWLGVDTDNFDPTNRSGTLDFTADGGGVSPIVASGNVNMNDGSSHLVVDMSLAPAGDILLVDVGGALSGTFTGLPEGAVVPGAGGRTITYAYGDGNDIALIPEPATAALMLCGFFGLIRRRR